MLLDGRPEANPKKSGVNYQKLGKAVEDALILDYIYILHSTRRQIWSSFMRGVFAGMGGVIGATVGIAVLLGILQLFGGAPIIGKYVKNITHTIENGPAAANPTPTPTPTRTPTPVPTKLATPSPTPLPAVVPTSTPTVTPVPTP